MVKLTDPNVCIYALVQHALHFSLSLPSTDEFVCKTAELIEHVEGRIDQLNQTSLTYLSGSMMKLVGLNKSNNDHFFTILRFTLGIFFRKQKSLFIAMVNSLLASNTLYFSTIDNAMKFDYASHCIAAGDVKRLELFLGLLAKSTEQTKLFCLLELLIEGVFEDKIVKFSSLGQELQFSTCSLFLSYLKETFQQARMGDCKICLSLLKFFIEKRDCDNFAMEKDNSSFLFDSCLRLLEITMDSLFGISCEKIKNEFFMKLFFLLPTKVVYSNPQAIRNFLKLGTCILKFSSMRRIDIVKLIEKCIPLSVDNSNPQIIECYCEYLKTNCILIDFDLFSERLKRLTSEYIEHFLKVETGLKSKNICPIFYQTLANEKSDWITQETMHVKMKQQETLSQNIIIFLTTFEQLILKWTEWNPTQAIKLFDPIWTKAIDNSIMLFGHVKDLCIGICLKFLLLLHLRSSTVDSFTDEFETESLELSVNQTELLNNFVKVHIIPLVQKLIPIRQKPISSKIQLVDDAYRIGFESWICSIEILSLCLILIGDGKMLEGSRNIYGVNSVWIEKNLDYLDSRLVAYYFYFFLVKHKSQVFNVYKKDILKILLLLLIERKTILIKDFLSHLHLIEPNLLTQIDSRRNEVFTILLKSLIDSLGGNKNEFNDFLKIFISIMKYNIKDGTLKNDTGIKYLSDSYQLLGCLIEQYSSMIYEPQSTKCVLPLLLAEFFSFQPNANFLLGISYPEYSQLLSAFCKLYTPHVLNALLQLDWQKDAYIRRQFLHSFENYLFNLGKTGLIQDPFVTFNHNQVILEKVLDSIFHSVIEATKGDNWKFASKLLLVAYSILSHLFSIFSPSFSSYLKRSFAWLNYVILSMSQLEDSVDFYFNFSLDWFFSFVNLLSFVGGKNEEILEYIYSVSLKSLYQILLDEFNIYVEFEDISTSPSFLTGFNQPCDSFCFSPIGGCDNLGSKHEISIRLVKNILEFWNLYYCSCSNLTLKRIIFVNATKIREALTNTSMIDLASKPDSHFLPNVIGHFNQLSNWENDIFI